MQKSEISSIKQFPINERAYSVYLLYNLKEVNTDEKYSNLNYNSRNISSYRNLNQNNFQNTNNLNQYTSMDTNNNSLNLTNINIQNIENNKINKQNIPINKQEQKNIDINKDLKNFFPEANKGMIKETKDKIKVKSIKEKIAV